MVLADLTVDQYCDAGYWCIEGSARPDPTDGVYGKLCPEGGYCPSGTPTVVACPQGQYNEAEGGESTADCANCKPGFYCFGTTSAGPTGLCFEGWYCEEGTIYPEAADANAYEATAGNYAPEGSSQQQECQRGSY